MGWTRLFTVALGAILVDNFIVAQFPGICPFMGVSRKIETTSGMGLAVIFVMGLASAICWPINELILVPMDLTFMQTVTHILVVASLVQSIEIFLKKAMPSLYETLGVYLPLITTNCAVLGVMLQNIQSGYNFVKSVIYDATGGIGFLLVIVISASIRGRIESFEWSKALEGFPIALMAAGLITLASVDFSGLKVLGQGGRKNITTAIIIVAVLAALDTIFGLVLAIASKVFTVEVSPRKEATLDCLPGTDCSGYGYPSCSSYVSVVVKGTTPVNTCAVGGETVAARIGEIMGMSADAAVKQIAQVHCTGCGQNYKQYTYVGIHDCVVTSKLPGGGDLGYAHDCLDLGSYEKACPFDAIHIIDSVARVNEEKCEACNKRVDICPRHIIALESYKTKHHVTIPCSSHDKDVDIRKVCDSGCIDCFLYAKSCPKEAITMVNNLAVIDYEECVGCGICAQKCPREPITVDGEVSEVKPAAPKTAPATAVEPTAPTAEEPAVETVAASKAEAPAEPKE